MNFRTILSRSCIISLASCATIAFAASNNDPLYRVNNSVEFKIPVSSTQNAALGGVQYKTISLMNIIPSERLEKRFQKQNENKATELDYSKGIKKFTNSSTSKDLGMGNVPVLDQGQYGTCVTFASTAALDALIGNGDYISQQCSLTLDEVDQADDTVPDDELNGNYWNGAYNATQVINPLMKQGVIKKGDCFESTYPTPYQTFALEDYTAKSEKTSLKSVQYEYDDAVTIDQVKDALNANHRVLIGSRIGSLVQGFDIKLVGDKTKKSGGLWACKQGSSSDYCNTIAGGHEIVVIGYDDAQQLLKIRNSWNVEVGDSGDYYMTYTYFNRMIMDGTIVSKK